MGLSNIFWAGIFELYKKWPSAQLFPEHEKKGDANL